MTAQNEINAKWENVVDWDSMGRVITQTHGQAFQTFG